MPEIQFLHVGAFRENDSDWGRILQVAEDLKKRGWQPAPGKATLLSNPHTFLDLNHGQDFFTPKVQPLFDVVVLHWIYDGPSPLVGKPSLYRVSPFHSMPNWRKQLAATGAKMIYAFGGEDEVGSAKLGDLKAYKMEPLLAPDEAGYNEKWVYIKKLGATTHGTHRI